MLGVSHSEAVKLNMRAVSFRQHVGGRTFHGPPRKPALETTWRKPPNGPAEKLPEWLQKEGSLPPWWLSKTRESSVMGASSTPSDLGGLKGAKSNEDKIRIDSELLNQLERASGIWRNNIIEILSEETSKSRHFYDNQIKSNAHDVTKTLSDSEMFPDGKVLRDYREEYKETKRTNDGETMTVFRPKKLIALLRAAEAKRQKEVPTGGEGTDRSGSLSSSASS